MSPGRGCPGYFCRYLNRICGRPPEAGGRPTHSPGCSGEAVTRVRIPRVLSVGPLADTTGAHARPHGRRKVRRASTPARLKPSQARIFRTASRVPDRVTFAPSCSSVVSPIQIAVMVRRSDET